MDATEEDGWTALMFSAQNGHDHCARALLEAKADPNIENHKHVTALNLACENEHEECAMLLLRYGAAADVRDDWGDTPRSTAQAKGMDRVLAMML